MQSSGNGFQLDQDILRSLTAKKRTNILDKAVYGLRHNRTGKVMTVNSIQDILMASASTMRKIGHINFINEYELLFHHSLPQGRQHSYRTVFYSNVFADYIESKIMSIFRHSNKDLSAASLIVKFLSERKMYNINGLKEFPFIAVLEMSDDPESVRDFFPKMCSLVDLTTVKFGKPFQTYGYPLRVIVASKEEEQLTFLMLCMEHMKLSHLFNFTSIVDLIADFYAEVEKLV